jgi:hypothetical protein
VERCQEIVVSINSMPVSTVDEMLEAYGELYGQDDFTVVLDRGGNSVTIEYRVE